MRQKALPVLIFALAITLLSACGPSDPQEAVALARSDYTVQLNSWRVVEPEPPEVVGEALDEGEESLGEEGEEATAAAAESAMAGAEEGEQSEEGEEGEDLLPEEPRTSTILFDLLVRFNGEDSLPGITVDITHADPFERQKEHRRQWIDTSNYLEGSLEQVSFELEGWQFEDGDVFSVELRPVPPEERGEYREFAEAGP